ncbi:MAG TPA: hypothetical protein VII56_13580 [Rhizomicrobium sp.]
MDDEIPPPRQHPWTVVVSNPNLHYWDFKSQPEQIPNVLEDFKPWAHCEAIQRFYELLSWLNGADSVFESNDCGLRPPIVDHATPEPIRSAFGADPVVMHCRLTFIVRDLLWNCSKPTVDAIKIRMLDALRENVPNIPAVVKVGEWAHFFTEVEKAGHAISLRIWAWGDDEAAAMRQLGDVFEALHGCLRWMSDGIKAQVARAT